MKKFLLISLFLLFIANICFASPGFKEDIYDNLVKAGYGLALAAIIYGGIRFILSVGDPSLMGEAKTWLISGVTGLILIAAATTIFKEVTSLTAIPTEIGTPGKVEVTEEPRPEGVYFCWGTTLNKLGENIDCYGPYTLSLSKTNLKGFSSIEMEPPGSYTLLGFSEPDYMGEMYKGSELLSNLSHVVSIAILRTKDVTGERTVRFYSDLGGGGGVREIKTSSETAELSLKKEKYDDVSEMKPGQIKKCGGKIETGKEEVKVTEYPKLYNPVSGAWLGTKKDPWCLRSIEIPLDCAVLLKGTRGGQRRWQLFLKPPGPANLADHKMWYNVRPAWATIIPFETKLETK